MSIGEEQFLRRYGSRLQIAEKFILGELENYEHEYAMDLLNPVIIEVARIRLLALNKLNSENIK